MTERDMLINLIDKAIYECDDNYGIPNSNQMADFLLENGVKVPPVEIGTTVYEIRRKGTNSSGKKFDNSVSTQRLLRFALSRGDDLYINPKPYVKSDYTRLGSTVYLTLKTAEEAIVRSENE